MFCFNGAYIAYSAAAAAAAAAARVCVGGVRVCACVSGGRTVWG